MSGGGAKVKQRSLFLRRPAMRRSLYSATPPRCRSRRTGGVVSWGARRAEVSVAPPKCVTPAAVGERSRAGTLCTWAGPVLGRSVRVAVVGAEEALHPLLAGAPGGRFGASTSSRPTDDLLPENTGRPPHDRKTRQRHRPPPDRRNLTVRSSSRLVCQPAKRTPHYNRVDLVNDALDDLGCDLGTVFLEDLRIRTDTLVGTIKSSVSSFTVWGAFTRSDISGPVLIRRVGRPSRRPGGASLCSGRSVTS